VLVGSDFENVNGRMWSVHLSDSLTVDWAWAYKLDGFAFGYTTQPLANGGYLFAGEGKADASLIDIKSYMVRADATGGTALCDSAMTATIAARTPVGAPTSMVVGQLPAGTGWSPIGVQAMGNPTEFNGCLTVGTDDQVDQEFLVRNNPTDEHVVISLPEGEWRHRLFTSNGSLVREWNTRTSSMEVQLRSPGLHMLVSQRDGISVVTRLIRQ